MIRPAVQGAELSSFFLACFFSLRGNRFLFFFTSFPTFFLGGVAFGAGAAFGLSWTAASFGCSFSASAFFRVAIATQDTTLARQNVFSRAPALC
jgi:hypothetical protein